VASFVLGGMVGTKNIAPEALASQVAKRLLAMRTNAR
jgi:hypothetical protein